MPARTLPRGGRSTPGLRTKQCRPQTHPHPFTGLKIDLRKDDEDVSNIRKARRGTAATTSRRSSVSQHYVLEHSRPGPSMVLALVACWPCHFSLLAHTKVGGITHLGCKG